MRNRSGYMINPISGRQIKMNSKTARNISRLMSGGSSAVSSDVSELTSQAESGLANLDKNFQSAMQAQQEEVSNLKGVVETARAATDAAEKSQKEAEQSIQSAIDQQTSAQNETAQIKDDIKQVSSLLSSLSGNLKEAREKSGSGSPFCAFDRLDKAFDDEKKNTINSQEGKVLFDQVNGFVGEISDVLGSVITNMGLFSKSNGGRRNTASQQVSHVSQDIDMAPTMSIGGGRKKRRSRSRRSRNRRR